MTEDPRKRKPLAGWQSMGNIHRRLNPSVEIAQVKAELKDMAREICEAAGRGEQRGGQQAQITNEVWVA